MKVEILLAIDLQLLIHYSRYEWKFLSIYYLLFKIWPVTENEKLDAAKLAWSADKMPCQRRRSFQMRRYDVA